MPQLMLRIGVALDADAKNIMAPVLASVKRARGQLATEGAAAAKALGDPFMRSAKEVAAAEAALAKASARAADKNENDRVKSAEKSAKDRVKVEKAANAAIERDYKRMVASMEKDAAQQARSEERLAAKRGRDANSSRKEQLGKAGAALGAVGSVALSFGKRIALDLARGAGINLDLGSHIEKSVQLQTQATELSNSGYMPGTKGANGERQDPAALMHDVQQIAKETAIDANEAMSGLQSFVGLTGDLETGRQTLKGLAVLSKATGTNLEDMAAAAANASNQLGDMEGKGDIVQKIMQGIAGQGKLGAVEIKDLASLMAKVAAQAGKFEGNTGDNVLLMGALAQEARQRGGAASAAEAATAVGSFSATFQKGARVKEFAAQGIDLMSKTDRNKFRNPEEIIQEALTKTGGDPTKMGKLFASVEAQKVTGGFGKIYNEAGGGAKGTAAVAAEFERLRNAAMDATETGASFAAAMETDASKAQKLNAALDELAGNIRTSLMPSVLGAGTFLAELLGLSDPNAGLRKRAAEDSASHDLIGKSKGDLSSKDRAKLLGDQTAFGAQRKGLEQQVEDAKAEVGRVNHRPGWLFGGTFADGYVGTHEERVAAQSHLDYTRMMLEQHNAAADKVDSFLTPGTAFATQFGYKAGVDWDVGKRGGKGQGWLSLGEGGGQAPPSAPTEGESADAVFERAFGGRTGLPQIGTGPVPLPPTKVDPTAKAVGDLATILKGELKVHVTNPKALGATGGPKADDTGRTSDGTG